MLKTIKGDRIMQNLTSQFVEYCQNTFDLNEIENYNYQSLSVCIIDCVYSLRAKYFSMTVPVVERYASRYMNNDKNSSGDTLSMFIQRIDEMGGTRKFEDEVFMNHQKIGGISKVEVCYQLARYLKCLKIDTLDDFRNFEIQELLEIVIRGVRGIGDAGVNYLFMLAGDVNRCKPDVHIHHCIKDACGVDMSNADCQTILAEAVKCLNQKYSKLTVRGLDGIIWRWYQSRS